MVVNRSATIPGAFTLQDWLSAYLKTRVLPESVRHGLVHRLDKETSGLMVVAKNTTTYYHLIAQFKQRLVKKNYLALVHGKLIPVNGNIRLPIKRDPKNRKKFAIWVGGKLAETDYQTLSVWENAKQKIKSKRYFSLVKIELKTGRTHQIRVHFSHLRHPVVGDTVYGGRKTARSDRSWCPRVFLQSTDLSFCDISGQKYDFHLDLDTGLDNYLTNKLIQV